VKATALPNVTLLQRLRSFVQWMSKFEDLFFGDPDHSVKRITALEVELSALRSATPRNFRKDSSFDALF
jgi:hypothetical protein